MRLVCADLKAKIGISLLILTVFTWRSGMKAQFSYVLVFHQALARVWLVLVQWKSGLNVGLTCCAKALSYCNEHTRSCTDPALLDVESDCQRKSTPWKGGQLL